MARRPTDAFRKLYDEHAGFVQFVAARAGARGPAVDDVVQETFMKLYQHSATLKDPSKVRAWLATTARHCAIDAARRGRRELGVETLDEHPAPSTHDHAAHEADLLLVGDLIAEIATHQGGETFHQFYVEGRSAKDIAALNGEAVSTVTTRLSRLREKFRARFRRRLEELREQRG